MRKPPVLLAWLLVCTACKTVDHAVGGDGEDPCFAQIQRTAIPVDGARILGILTGGTGSLLVTGAETDSLTVAYALCAVSREIIYRNQVETIDKADSLFVTIRPDPAAQIELQIGMPEEMTVDLRDEARDVIFRNVENRVDVFLHTRGSLDFDDIEGPLTIEDGVGRVSIHDVRGPIVIRDQGGGISIADVQNTVRIETGDGDVSIVNTGADIQLAMGAGRLVVRDVVGRLTYHKTGPGEVTIENVSGGVTRQ